MYIVSKLPFEITTIGKDHKIMKIITFNHYLTNSVQVVTPVPSSPIPTQGRGGGGAGVTEVRKDSLGNLPGFVDNSETCSAKSSQ